MIEAIDSDTAELIERALAEDAAFDDRTAQATIAADARGRAHIVAKASGVLSGRRPAADVFRRLDPAIRQEWHKQDGDPVEAGETICRLAGPLRAILAAERTALNFLQHLSGVATLTRRFVDAVAGTGCAIADTRKTTPGLRRLEKQAVVHGGGVNHRMDLASGMLVKENHIAAAGSNTAAVEACRRIADGAWIEVECETLAEVREAVAAAPDIILLDNMTPTAIRDARTIVPGSILLEASGNITLANAREYAVTGVDRLAVGAITHSAPALDLSLRVTAR
ncbi:MAG: carboxylating nicotinate-nucleotide diphosphorylase [Mariprofundaceae bacterium]